MCLAAEMAVANAISTFASAYIKGDRQLLIAEIAKTDSSRSVREAAAEKLTDQAVLAEIAKSDKDSSVREATVKKLTDQAVLAEIAKSDKDSSVREATVKEAHRSSRPSRDRQERQA